ncbi:MAG: diacylglycerol kinase family protein [Nitrospirota bacterium]
MRIKFIGNPKAGKENLRKIKMAVHCLRESAADVQTFVTGKKGDAEAWARESTTEGVDRVVVAGGDGTINEAINGLAGSTIPLGIIPLGVSNVLSLELGLPLSIERASETALNGAVKSITLGMANNRYFSLWTGIGFDAEVVCRLNLRFKPYLGKLAYILTGLKVFLKYKAYLIDIITDTGEQLKGYSAIISKSKFYGGRFKVTPEAGINKEELDICLFQNGTRRDILRYVLGIVTGRHLSFRDVVYRKVKGLKITSQGRVPVHIDGDCFGELPVEISLKTDAVKLVFPK